MLEDLVFFIVAFISEVIVAVAGFGSSIIFYLLPYFL
jgi:hypothetical protein